ncbi:endosulfine [Anaeramoeba flamelloides]|uniref:Endosulfine n=1 Tax=Anaeramoeba flamelloides TaxID=1746091 RepID=A0AAV7ZBH0_9EUKA|nr:endosulfine isoform a [Anaeramoeba flamelloides]KAJ6233426.1 endosulfine [Anaeramoeba flamelloides]
MSNLNPQKKQEQDISDEFSNLSGNKKVASHLLSRGSLHNKGFDSADWSMGTDHLKNVNKKSNMDRNRGRNQQKTKKSRLTVSIESTENDNNQQSGTRLQKTEIKTRGKSPLRDENN